MSDMAKNLILWLVIAVVLMSVFQGFGGDNVAANKLDYTSFVQEVERGSVAKIMVSEDGITLNG
ncbi:MAG: ATP-dependent metallopeptidase FtsH/Yme1/Tma family protein, partial [Psychrobium sp.]|nr:ATP-dependent metallopeptidase FtsH/Yme1/Tma family protein [Psychrobium sp.]